MARVADALVDALVDAGVRQIFGVAGDSLNAITDSIRSRRDIEWIHVRHEEAAGFAAGAVAQLTGGLAVCAGSCGPGNLHLINGLYDAHRSRARVIALAAQIPSPEIGSNYFQETHPEQIFRECSHYQGVVSKVEDLAPVVESALDAACNRMGVAVIVLPGDVALMRAQGPKPNRAAPKTQSGTGPTADQIRRMAHTLNDASRVTVLAGSGCAGSRDELFQIAAKLHAPIVHTLRAKESLEYDNPYDVGMTGLIGFSSGYHAMMDSEVLLMLGTDFPYRQFYPEHAQKIQVDIDPEQIGRRTAIDIGVVADVGTTLRALLPAVQEKSDGEHLTASLEHYAKTRESLDALATGEPGKSPVHPQFVVKVLDRLSAGDAIFTCDVGLPTVWAARYLRMNGRRRLLGSFWHGSMANALPQAIGAACSSPGRQVVSLCGDGGLAMLFGELLTLRQLNLPVKVIVFNNGALGFVRLEQMSAGFLEAGVDLRNPDFSRVAEAVGIEGLRAEVPEEIEPKTAELLRHPGPALLDVTVSNQEVAMPPSLDRSVVKGFSLWLVKAVLSGRGDEIVDLAKVNLFR